MSAFAGSGHSGALGYGSEVPLADIHTMIGSAACLTTTGAAGVVW